MDTHKAWQLMTAMLLTVDTNALLKNNTSNATVSTEKKSAVIIKLINRYGILGGMVGLWLVLSTSVGALAGTTVLCSCERHLKRALLGIIMYNFSKKI